MINIDRRAGANNFSYAASASPGLKPYQIRKIAEAINPVIADGFALYEKTKNFYLRLADSCMRNHQPLFDEQAREIFDSMDALVEQLRQIGAPAVPGFSHTNELQNVESYHSDLLSPGKMMEELASDNQQIVVSLRIAGGICRELREAHIGNVLQEVLDQTERRIKFLSEAKLRI